MFDDSLSGSEVEEPLLKKKVYNEPLQMKLLISKLKNAQAVEIDDKEEQISELQQSIKDLNENSAEREDQCKNVIVEEDEEVRDAVDEPEDCTSVVFLNRNTSSARSPGRKNTDILDSAEVKDLSWTQRCLGSGSSPEATCQQGKLSVCHLAAYFGDAGIIKEVITRRPDLFKRADSAGRTPLHYAAWGGHLECLAILLGLQSGALETIKNRKEPDNITELKIHFDKLQSLNSTHGESIDVLDQLCDPSHSCASVFNALDVVWSSCTPLHNACARVQTDCVLALLACGADITKHDAQGRTPLDVCGLAIKEAGKIAEIKLRSFVKIIEAFIEYGKHYNVNRDLWLTNKNGTSPLHVAVLFNSKKATKLLLDINAVPCLLDEEGQTPLHLAVLQRKTHILKALANSPSNKILNYVDVANQNERTPLQLAILEEWFDGVSILLDANASIIDQSNTDRNSALHFAAQVGDLEIADKLIEKLPNKKEWIDCKNNFDETPLFVAIKQGNASCVRCFLQEGASYNVLLGGYTVIHKAIESDNRDVLISLLDVDKVGNLLNITNDKEGMTPLHWAALKGRADYTEILINKGADMTLRNSEGHTALHIAAKEGHSDVIKVILTEDKEKSLVNIKDNQDWLPFYRAAYHCQRDTIEMFLENGSNFAEVVPLYSGKKSIVISIIKNNMPRSAEYLNSIFDKHMSPNAFSLDHPECEVAFDYSIIIPEDNMKNFSQMDAIAALFSSGSNFEINKLILHPYIESFLYLKWKILRWFFFVILGIYGLFVILLTDITIHMYEETYQNAVSIAFLRVKQSFLMLLICILLIVEILFMRLFRRWKYFKRIEGWVKPCSVVMALLIIITDIGPYGHNISRPVVAIALLFSWMEITILLSRFPEFGYYFQMFSTVALRVVKVFALFGCFVIIGFSLIFWILIRTNESFLSPWDSLIKTIVMMTSEFDYSDLTTTEDGEKMDQVIVQLFFIIFLVCVPIVLMNLLLALAVSDVKDLETEGKIERLKEQVEFLSNLEVLAEKILPETFTSKKTFRVERSIQVYLGKPFWDPGNKLPRNIIESICENINTRKENDERDQKMKDLLRQVEDTFQFIQKQEIIHHKRHMELVNNVNQLSIELQNSKAQEKAKSNWERLLKM